MREYGKRTKIAENYYEVEYKEYREDGTLKMTGKEDFSKERLHQIKEYSVHIPSDKTNKGGQIIWDELGDIKATNRKDAMKIAKSKYGNEKEIQLRKWF